MGILSPYRGSVIKSDEIKACCFTPLRFVLLGTATVLRRKKHETLRFDFNFCDFIFIIFIVDEAYFILL